MAYAIGSAPGGGVLMSDGTIVRGSTNLGNGVTYTNTPSNTKTNTGLQLNGGGSVLGANTGGGGNNGGTPSGGPNVTTQADLAQQALQSRLNGINDRLRMLKEQADQQSGVALGVRNEVLGNIDTTYGGLKTAAQTNRDNSLAALSEADRGTVSDYAQNQGSLNASAAGAEQKNRALARALGYGNSSYYLDTQDKTRASLLDKTAGLQNEKTSKLGAIKGKVADTNTWFDQKNTEIAQEAATLKSQADRQYQQDVANAQLASRTYGVDAVDQANQAQIEYQSKLDSISNYIGNKSSQLSTIANAANTQKSSINGFNPIAAIQPTLNASTGINNAATPFSTIAGDSGYSTPTTNRSLLAKYLINPNEQYLYGYQQPLQA
jgi:hypothetical protein